MKSVFWVSAVAFSFQVATVAATWSVAQDDRGDFKGSDEAPLLAAISRARSAGGGEILIRPGVYRIGRNISLDGVRHVRIRGEGEVTLKLAPALVTELAAPAVVGGTSLTLRSPDGLRAGLKLRILAPGEILEITGKPRPTFDCTIAAVDGTKVTLKEPLRFRADAGTRVLDDNDLNLFTIARDCEDVTIENLTLDGALEPGGLRQATHQTRCGVWVQGRFDYLKGPTAKKPSYFTIRDCRIRNFHGRGIAIYSADDCLVENCVIENTLDEGIDFDHFAVRCRAIGNIVRFATVGIEMNDANHCMAARNLVEDCARGFRLWRYCKLGELNVHNVIASNRLRRIQGAALDFQPGTSENIARDNVLELPAGITTTTPTRHFLDAGTGNRLERNRIDTGWKTP